MTEDGLLRPAHPAERVAVTDPRLENALQPRFYVMMRRILDREKAAKFRQEHLGWMIDMERRGVLFLSGPASSVSGDGPIQGMTILRAEGPADARRIADSEPFIVEGAMAYDLYEWTVFEGALAVSVRISAGLGDFR